MDPLLQSNLKHIFFIVILAASRLQWGSCGVGGSVRANISLADGSRCVGSLTDWNAESCRLRSILTVNSPRCPLLQNTGGSISYHTRDYSKVTYS